MFVTGVLVTPDYDRLRLISLNNFDSRLANLIYETGATHNIGRAHAGLT